MKIITTIIAVFSIIIMGIVIAVSIEELHLLQTY